MSATTRVPLAAAVAIVAGNMIGTGVFGSLGYQVAGLPSAFLIALLWIVGGVLAFCGAVNYAELSAAMPQSGGEYFLLSRLYHPAVGFAGGWVSLTVGFPAPVASAALLFAEHCCRPLGIDWPLGMRQLAAGLVTVVTGLHLLSVRASGRFQTWATLLKVLLIAGLAAAGWAAGNRAGVSWLPGAPDGLTGAAELPAGVAGRFAVSLMYVLFAYSGWNAACYIAGEVERPQRTVPLALLIGTGLVMLLYTGLNTAILMAVPMKELAGRPDPAAVAAAAWFGPAGGAFVAFLIAVGLVSTVSAMTWAGPRVAQAMGRDNRAFGFLAATSPTGVPVRAVLLQYVLALFLIFSSDVEKIMVRTEFVLQLFLLLTVWGVIQLRLRRPDLTRPYRAWAYPFSTVGFLVATAMIMGMTLHHRPAEAQWGIGLVAIGVLVHFFARRPDDGRGASQGKPSTCPDSGS